MLQISCPAGPVPVGGVNLGSSVPLGVSVRSLPISGRFNPLSEQDLLHIHSTALGILARIGLSDAPQVMIDAITAGGGRLSDDGRLLFPKPLVDKALAGMRRSFKLFGRGADHRLYLTGGRGKR